MKGPHMSEKEAALNGLNGDIRKIIWGFNPIDGVSASPVKKSNFGSNAAFFKPASNKIDLFAKLKLFDEGQTQSEKPSTLFKGKECWTTAGAYDSVDIPELPTHVVPAFPSSCTTHIGSLKSQLDQFKSTLTCATTRFSRHTSSASSNLSLFGAPKKRMWSSRWRNASLYLAGVATGIFMTLLPLLCLESWQDSRISIDSNSCVNCHSQSGAMPAMVPAGWTAGENEQLNRANLINSTTALASSFVADADADADMDHNRYSWQSATTNVTATTFTAPEVTTRSAKAGHDRHLWKKSPSKDEGRRHPVSSTTQLAGVETKPTVRAPTSAIPLVKDEEADPSKISVESTGEGGGVKRSAGAPPNGPTVLKQGRAIYDNSSEEEDNNDDDDGGIRVKLEIGEREKNDADWSEVEREVRRKGWFQKIVDVVVKYARKLF